MIAVDVDHLGQWPIDAGFELLKSADIRAYNAFANKQAVEPATAPVTGGG